MSSSSNYNAITNLVETIIDYLIVDTAEINTATIQNLDCNVGVIDTLTSTTATLTSANIPTLTNTTQTSTTSNITTANITTANITNNNSTNTNISSLTASKLVKTDASKNLISSSYTDTDMAILSANNSFTGTNTFRNVNIFSTYVLTCGAFASIGSAGNVDIAYNQTTGNTTICNTQTTGNVQIGNTTPASDSGTLTINKTTTLGTNKNLTLQGTGKITTPNALISGLTASKIVLTDASKNLISSSYTDTDFARLTADNTFSGNNTFSGTTATFNPCIIKCNTYTGLGTNSNLSLGQLADTGSLTIYKTTNIPSLTASKMVLTDASKNLVSSSYTDTDFARLTADNTFSGNNTFSGSTATFNPCVIKSNTYTGLGTNSNLSLGQLADTGSLTIYKTTNIPSLTASKMVLTDASKNLVSSSYTDTDFVLKSGSSMSGTLNVNDIQGTTTSSAITLFTNSSVSTPTITLGNVLGGTFTINPNTQLNGALTLATGKNLTMSSTGNIVGNTYQGTSLASVINLFASSTGGGNFFTGLRNSVLNIGSSSFSAGVDTGYITIYLPLYVNQDLNMDVGKNVILSSTGKVVCNTIESASTGSVVNILGNHLFNTNIGNSSNGGTIDFNQGVKLVSGKNLSLVSGSVLANTLNPYNTGVGDQFVVCSSFTTQPIIIGNNQTTGNITIGNTTPASDSGTLTLNKNTTSVSGKYIATERLWGLSATGTLNVGYNNGETGIISLNRNTEVPVGRTLKCESYQSNTATTALALGSTNTTANINIGGALTSGAVVLSNNSATGGVYSQADLYTLDIGTQTGKNLFTATIKSHTFLGVVSSGSLYDTTLTNNITMGAGLTSGQIKLSNTSATNPVVIQNKAQFTTATESCWINSSTGNTLFTATSLLNKYLSSNIYAGAPTDQWSVWDSNTANASGGDASAICQNGNTTIIINPGDQQTLHWIDEDIMTTATNYAITSGWKISTAGVISTYSDRRLKRRITPIVDDNILDKLLQLEIVKFQFKPPTPEKEYKDGVLRRKYTDYHYGYIAQNVNDVIPEACDRVDADSYWTLKKDVVNDYFSLGVQALIKQNKQQQAQIDDLTSRLARLEQILLNP